MCSGVSDSSNKFPAQKVIKREKKFRQNSAAGGDNTICPRSIDLFYIVSPKYDGSRLLGYTVYGREAAKSSFLGARPQRGGGGRPGH